MALASRRAEEDYCCWAIPDPNNSRIGKGERQRLRGVVGIRPWTHDDEVDLPALAVSAHQGRRAAAVRVHRVRARELPLRQRRCETYQILYEVALTVRIETAEQTERCRSRGGGASGGGDNRGSGNSGRRQPERVREPILGAAVVLLRL